MYALKKYRPKVTKLKKIKVKSGLQDNKTFILELASYLLWFCDDGNQYKKEHTILSTSHT